MAADFAGFILTRELTQDLLRLVVSGHGTLLTSGLLREARNSPESKLMGDTSVL